MTDSIGKPASLSGKQLLEVLEFSVTGPEFSDRARRHYVSELDAYEASANIATIGMRHYLLQQTGAVVGDSAIEISSTYPPVARLARTGTWHSGGPFYWDGFPDDYTPEDMAKAFALLLNADDLMRDLHGPVWGPIAAIMRIADDQAERYKQAELKVQARRWPRSNVHAAVDRADPW